jgi:DNA repair photolyase
MATATADGTLFSPAMPGPRLIRVARRGPLLRPSPASAGTYGLDLTAGCGHGCPFCHIRSSSRYPGDDVVRFDPFSSEHLPAALDALDLAPDRVVLSPSSDPLPALREVRDEAYKVARILFERDVCVQIMTRGRFSRAMIELLSRHRDRARVAVGLMTMDKAIARTLEPRAASPTLRVRDVRRLIEAGVDVEVRLEPLIPERTDTADNLRPVFQAMAAVGVRKVVAHYLYLHPALADSLDESFQPLPWGERLRDEYEGGPVFRLGSLGATKHLPLAIRRAGLARMISLGMEFGLSVTTGSSQNPDLPRSG